MLNQWLDRSTLLAGELSTREISQLVTSGNLRRIRRGRYVVRDDWDAADEQQRHCLRARELACEMAGRAVVSHESAALLHGLALPAGFPSRIHLTWPGSPGRSGTPNVTPHRGRLDDVDVVQLDGVAVTSVARTVFDVGRLGVWTRAISAADSALHLRLCSRADLADVVRRTERTPGGSRARRIIEFADGLSESVGESICRLRMAQLGLPIPTLQSLVTSLDQASTYRVDFEFLGLRTVAEFDGKIKYGRLLAPGQTPGDAAFAEKVREDRIRDTGRQFVRIVWSDLNAPEGLVPRFAAAFQRSGFADWKPGAPRFFTPRSAAVRGGRSS